MTVSYGVKLVDATITLSGKTLGANGQDNILVGQNCTPHLAVSGLPAGVYVGWPQWSISGNTYKSFDIAPVFNVSKGQQTGGAVPYPNPADTLLPPPTVYIPPTFYWKDGDIQGQLQVVQASADLYTDPAGSLSQHPVLPASAYIGTVVASKMINVWSPAEYDTPSHAGVAIPNPELGTVGLENGTVTTSANNTLGFAFEVAVGTPDLFTASRTVFGSWAWLQLVQINETQGSNGLQMVSPQLDSAFPYTLGAGTANGVPGPTQVARSTSILQQYSEIDDSPTIPYYDYQTAVAFADDFNLYVMFQPPNVGNGVNWVPLYLYQWEFSGNMTRPNIFSNWTPNPPGSIKLLGHQQNPSYPSWTSKYAP